MSETQTTLRETLAAELEKLPETTVEPIVEPVKPEETAEQREIRLRDEKGRFAPGKVEAKSDVKQIESKPRPQRPSSWKKEYWDQWDKLEPNLAEYINQREQEYAKGVSTYKNEWDQAKPLIEAIAPFQQTLQQFGLKPEQWITNLGTAHRALVLGSPQEKIQMFQKLAQDYKVPLQQLFVRGEDGQIYFNQNFTQQPPKPPDVRQTVMDLLAEREVQNEVSQVQNDKEKFPYFEQVKSTMAGLLQSGLAEDLKSAYDAALRIPKHSDLFDQLQQQQRDKEEKDRLEKNRQVVSGAKAKNISPKTSTPSGPAVTGKKDLRSELEENFDSVVGGRV